LLAWNQQQSIRADAIRGKKTSIDTTSIDGRDNRTPIWPAQNERPREWFMTDDEQSIFAVVLPPPIILVRRSFDADACLLWCAQQPAQWIDSRMHRGPQWIASTNEWHAHRTAQYLLCFIKQIRIRKNVHHFSEPRGKVVRTAIHTRTTQRRKCTRLMIAADQINSPPLALTREDFFHDEVRTRSLGEQISDENHSAPTRPCAQTIKHCAKFLAATVNVSDDDRIAHRRTILARCRFRFSHPHW